jgi:hypothetical protein
MESKHAVIHLMGGLGNQLFQIVFGLAMQKRFGVQLHLDTSGFSCGQGSHPSKYFESIYKNILHYFTNSKHTYTYTEKIWNYYNVNNDILNAYNSHDCIQFTGYWQSGNYFPNMKTELRKLFSLDHPYLYIPKLVWITYPQLHDIGKNGCLISVRRGDYIKHPHIHNPCGMSYYNQAMSYFPKETTFFVISDDLEWCRLQFASCKGEFVFLDISDDLVSFYIGTLFSNYIMSNSTFYWWMSYFSVCANPRIVAPDKWISLAGVSDQWIYRSDMIVLERPVEV